MKSFMFDLFRNVIGFFAGIVFTTLFQKPVNNLCDRIYRLIFSIFRNNTHSLGNTFRIGNRNTNIVIIDGDGRACFDDKNINVHIDNNKPFEWPSEVALCYNNTLNIIERKRKMNEQTPWNGSILNLWKYRIERTPNREDYSIHLFMSEESYYHAYSTITNLENPSYALKEKYIDSFVFENENPYMLPNAMGICILIRTKDSKAIFSIRSSSSGYRPGESDVSVVEGLSPQLDVQNRTISFTDVATRAIQEELCNVETESINVALLGIIFDKCYNQWNVICHVDLDLTQNDIILRRNNGASGKWELKSLDFIQYSPREIIMYLATHKMWDSGIATTYFSLIHCGYSYDSINKLSTKYIH